MVGEPNDRLDSDPLLGERAQDAARPCERDDETNAQPS
jgi:hypothetical protein